MSHRTLPALLGAGALSLSLGMLPLTADASPPRVADTLRVNPYLQNPSSTSMTVTWFSTADKPGTLILNGPGRQQRHTSTPEPQAALDYTRAERDQEIKGLAQGSWIRQSGNVKHVVQLTDLKPDTTYHYTVRQGRDRHDDQFHTAPSADDWDSIRFISMSDSETEPLGRVQRREWSPGAGGENRPGTDSAWAKKFGTTELSKVPVLNYPLTEDEGYRRNLAVVQQRDPDFVLNTGDLVQGGGYQPGWDEWFRHNAGEVGSGLSSTPVLPAFGNWESFGALNDGYGTPEDRSAVVRSRAKYHAYFDSPSNGTPEHRDNYYRVDYGPVTVITLDGNNGEPDDSRDKHPDKAKGQEYRGPGTDTQDNFTREQYEAAGGTDLSDFNPGSRQWNWAERQLAEAREDGRIVFVQFHHVPFSSGEHGLPMYHELSSGQGATPMRQYHPMFEKYGVSAVLSGHSEMFERSFVDSDGDGVGVHYYDVGVSGDGLRGERRNGSSLNDPLLKYNEFSRWTADQNETEQWKDVDGVPQLISGGKHYGHLEVNVTRIKSGQGAAKVTLTPVHNFPVLDGDYNLVRTERRTYDDGVSLTLDSTGRVIN